MKGAGSSRESAPVSSYFYNATKWVAPAEVQTCMDRLLSNESEHYLIAMSMVLFVYGRTLKWIAQPDVDILPKVTIGSIAAIGFV